jgi:hypothetical protein
MSHFLRVSTPYLPLLIPIVSVPIPFPHPSAVLCALLAFAHCPFYQSISTSPHPASTCSGVYTNTSTLFFVLFPSLCCYRQHSSIRSLRGTSPQHFSLLLSIGYSTSTLHSLLLYLLREDRSASAIHPKRRHIMRHMRYLYQPCLWQLVYFCK